jgi:type IV pilus assembly protein PilM
MSWFSADVIPKSFLGIDIGSSALRIVEIGGWGDRRSLKNYGGIQVDTLYEKPFRSFAKNTLLLSTRDIAKALKGVLQEAGIKERRAVLSISDFSTFFTTLELPPMKEKELPDAVRFEARRHVPLPLSEVILDWQLLEKEKEGGPYRLLLVAVPKEVVHYYEEIARFSGLKLVALEAEVFGNVRAYVQEEKDPVVLVDIGSHTTTVSVVSEGLLRVSRTIDVGGNSLTERVAKGLSIDSIEAEHLKIKEGVHLTVGNVLPVVDLIGIETRKVLEGFARQDKARARKIVLSGGSARLPGFREYIEKEFERRTEISAPFSNMLYPPLLEEVLKEIGPSYAVAAGMALRGFE